MDQRRVLRAAAYGACALFLGLALRAWLRPAEPGAVPDVLADASRPDPLPMDEAAAPAKERPVVHAPGEPVEPEARAADEAVRAASAAPTMTNEQLHAALEREKVRMGIKHIVVPRPAPNGALPVPEPVSAPALPGATPALLAKAPAAAAQAPAAAASGVIVLSEAERAALWASKGMAAAPPTVDYSRQRLAVVFSQSPSYGIEVAAVQTFSDRVVVQLREPLIPEDARRESRAPAYQFRVLPLSDKPVIFQKLP